MKALVLASVLALGGCKTMTSVRTVHGPMPTPVPTLNPEIQPELEHFEFGALGKTILIGAVLVGCVVLWRWDDE
tara:strand:- start:196 stop:417 length:222 start_codon:yes stop_codon:yes gene_type:complete